VAAINNAVAYARRLATSAGLFELPMNLEARHDPGRQYLRIFHYFAHAKHARLTKELSAIELVSALA
jgi:hypothetical protein